jgi:sulfur carrier protein ThiS
LIELPQVKERKIAEMIKKLIFFALILVNTLCFYLLDRDINEYSQIIEEQQVQIAEQQTQIDDLKKQLGYHNLRITSQMDTLMVHRSRLEQIKVFLENWRSGFASKINLKNARKF